MAGIIELEFLFEKNLRDRANELGNDPMAAVHSIQMSYHHHSFTKFTSLVFSINNFFLCFFQ
jgi:hypothetical protein